MATTVYNVEEIVLQDGSLVTLKPANIKVMRKGQEMITGLGEIEDDDQGIEKLLDIVVLCLKRQRPEFEHEVEEKDEAGKKVKRLVPDYDLLEELFDLDTVFKVIEVYLGVKLNDPKLVEAAAQAAMIHQAAEAQNGANSN